MTRARDSIDDLVQSVTCYNGRPLFMHGYIGPFVTIYAALMYQWFTFYMHLDKAEVWYIYVAIAVVSQVLALLFCMWSVHVNCFLAYNRAPSPTCARYAKVVPTPNNGSTELVPIYRQAATEHDPEQLFLYFQKTKYTFDFKSETFEVVDFPLNHEMTTYQEWKGYNEDHEIMSIERKYGNNLLVMDIPSAGELFKERATAPFFVFQVFCVGLWCLEEFWYYSLFTLFMLVMFEMVLVQQQIRNMSEIRKMGNAPRKILVYRTKKWKEIMSNELVAGDVVSISRSNSESDQLVPCDMLLLRGNMIVDESMLTGESVPQMKESIEAITDVGRRLDIDSDGRLHVLFSGTKVVQHTPPSKEQHGLRPTDGGCVGYVLRTGFNTSQGKLLRTILFGVKRVTANNLETFFFILFLLMFAVTASAYVWIEGTKDPNRNRYKLFLECTLILTSVVPPELPIELSLAVNTSLLSLTNLYIYCTEPFRIPFAGKVEICCFDKTGTLTSDNLIVEGVAGISSDDSKDKAQITPVAEAPPATIQVLASCHSLVHLEKEGLVGDPLEKSTLEAVNWNLTKSEAVIPNKGNQPGLKIYNRFHFSSALKRMSVIAGYQSNGETMHIGCVKGAPETLKSMFKDAPDDYDDIHTAIARKGARVLALGRKDFGSLSHQQLRDMTRDEIEQDLEFAGFLVISCPLKKDSKKIISEIIKSSHRVMMITGDSPLTACHVAKELDIAGRTILILKEVEPEDYQWVSINEDETYPMVPANSRMFFHKYDLCLTGDSMTYLLENEPKMFLFLLPHISVFSRVAPKQKEVVITSLRSLGIITLMCGDGTNDVGALKHAHVGVALISNAPLSAPPRDAVRPLRRQNALENGPTPVAKPRPTTDGDGPRHRSRGPQSKEPMPRRNQVAHNNLVPVASPGRPLTEREKRNQELQIKMKELMKEIEEMDQAPIKLGDASIAAPFTSKLSSIQCVCHIIKQGRCTLVTTLQMFKILALNALILAYSQSVLYLDGIKFSDSQATLQGFLLAGCFLFISRSKPLNILSHTRPLPNIFNVYTILTVVAQFAIHFMSLIYLVREAIARSPPKPEFADLEAEFAPSILNSTVYLISVSLQVSTFAVNYKGYPFMESLKDNKPLLYSIAGAGTACVCLATNIFPDFTNWFSIVEFPPEFQSILLMVLVGDFAGAFIVDRILEMMFGKGKLRSF